MFRNSNFEKALESATSHLHLEPDWPSILLICDSIRQNDVTPKNAFAVIKKKMSSPNPHSAYYSLLVLESVVKNCGSPIHEEIFTRENCEMFNNFIEDTAHENVRAKMLELIQCWAYAFRSTEKYQSIKDCHTILKTKGHKFPELKEADAMFSADTAPKWADGKVCHRCRVEFSLTQRKHHCRNCGQVFCAQCSSKTCPLPKFGIEKEVRVCDGCYTYLLKPSSKRQSSSQSSSVDSDLPAEYLNSSLSQQPQQPARKSEQELKEEEEFQLALALSQSEAEQKKTYQYKPISYQPPAVTAKRSPSPDDATVPDLNKHQDETVTDPELAKYLNRSYWEQKQKAASNSTTVVIQALNEPASPSAPSPMPQSIIMQNMINKMPAEDSEIDDFAANMKTQVEIFVNRMKSNSSRGRNISNDSSVQTLFMNLTSLHSQLLTYIKQMDDKRMWYEELQDKLTQIKDSRAALDVLRSEHIEKLRRAAEEQERLRQLQMAQKLEIMRKKKQEYLQYQRQLALQRIQEQEREMQIRQEQQKAQYRQQSPFPFPGQQNSPSHQLSGGLYQSGFNSLTSQNQIPGITPYSQSVISQQMMPSANNMYIQQPVLPGMQNPHLVGMINPHQMIPGNPNMPAGQPGSHQINVLQQPSSMGSQQQQQIGPQQQQQIGHQQQQQIGPQPQQQIGPQQQQIGSQQQQQIGPSQQQQIGLQQNHLTSQQQPQLGPPQQQQLGVHQPQMIPQSQQMGPIQLPGSNLQQMSIPQQITNDHIPSSDIQTTQQVGEVEHTVTAKNEPIIEEQKEVTTAELISFD